MQAFTLFPFLGTHTHPTLGLKASSQATAVHSEKGSRVHVAHRVGFYDESATQKYIDCGHHHESNY